MADEPVDLGIEDLTDAEEIGAGGFGTVFRAHQTSLRREVAVKMVNNAIRDRKVQIRFEREIQAMGMLSGHPNIVTVYDSGYTGSGQPYILMGFMEKGSLADRLEETGPISYPEVLEIVIKVAGALETAHQAGILHRDIKPENVLVSAYGEPKLGDFGIARLKGGPETGTASLTASIEHVSPELLEAEPPSKASDVYALGSTMYKLLTGKAAFVRDDDESIVPALARIRAEPVPDLRAQGIPDPVSHLVERAMDKDPAQRFPTAAAFGQAAQEVQRQLGLSVTNLPVRSEDAAAVKEATRAIDSSELAEQVALARGQAGVTGSPFATGPAPTGTQGHPLIGQTQPGYAPPSGPQGTPPPTSPGYPGGFPPGQPGYGQPPPHAGGPARQGMSTGAKVGIGIAVVALIGLVTAGIVLATRGDGPEPTEDPTAEPTEPAEYSDFTQIRDDSRVLAVNVPVEWTDRDGAPWVIDGQEVGQQIRASTDLDAFTTSWTVPGLIFSASEQLAGGYTPAQLADQLDFSGECSRTSREDYSDPVYTGVRVDYTGCGNANATYTVIAAEPASGDALVLVQFQSVAPRDDEALQEVINTFVRTVDVN